MKIDSILNSDKPPPKLVQCEVSPISPVPPNEPSERPFACDVCGAAFKRNGDRNRHRRRHFPELWEFKCSLCGKVFDRSDSMKRHEVKCKAYTVLLPSPVTPGSMYPPLPYKPRARKKKRS